ncbi:MAG: sporulation protein [Crocinitomicaceae bacterium]|jgi:hypothetical protein|nr:sporulation protein [Crocinitomicaceae bacterium]
MKQAIYLSAALLLFSCNSEVPANTGKNESSEDTILPKHDSLPGEENPGLSNEKFANKRFRNVTVERLSEQSFRIRGQAQVFEATFSWVVEDGHDQLKKGFEMTDAGAPEWGNFDFKIDVSKKRPNSTLTLILFEASAMDGSPQHELPVALTP